MYFLSLLLNPYHVINLSISFRIRTSPRLFRIKNHILNTFRLVKGLDLINPAFFKPGNYYMKGVKYDSVIDKQLQASQTISKGIMHYFGTKHYSGG